MLCDGTLGENIFEDGDFGSGFLTTLTSDPYDVSPDYGYQSNPPPNDGFYTITNNTSTWGSFAASAWIPTADNSTDPNGYMMVVNADYTPGIFYENTVDNLCENTFYQFTADVINLMQVGGIRPNIDFLIDGQVSHTTGDIPVDGQWNTYGFTFTTAPNTTSLTLAIRNNAPGGQGNDLAIDNIEFRACGPETFIKSAASICEDVPATLQATLIGDQYPTPYYQWQLSLDAGNTWDDLVGENQDNLYLPIPTAGNFYRLLISNSSATIMNPKCRIISNEYEMVIAPTDYLVFDTLCNGLTYQVGNSSYDSSGIYVDSLMTTLGCDSVITTHLKFAPDLGITADIEIQDPTCPNEASGRIFISNIQNGSGSYNFFLDGISSDGVPAFENLPAGDFTLTILDNYKCETTYEVQLIDPQAFVVDLGEDASISLGEQHEVFTQSNFPVSSYIWLNTTGFDCTTDCLSPTIYPTEDVATYQIVATDFRGCTATDEVTILVDKTRKIFIPNAFSPDGDGYNDYFTVFGGIDVERVVNFRVFNRWGAVVFSSNNFQPNDELVGWNGIVNGKKVDSGVYVYTAEILFKDGLKEIFYGDVLVVE